MPDNKDGYSNLEMLQNQANAISHHAEELQQTVKKRDEEVMPWVITKTQRASTDLSDVTHYLEGEAESYAKGGHMEMDYDIDDFDAPHELALGGRLEVGKTYRAKDGNSYRYVGGDYFLDGQRNYVKKGRDEFEGHFYEDGGVIDADSVVPGARFKNPSGTVFIVDDVREESSSVDQMKRMFVYSSFEGGGKGNYRDPLEDFVAFMNEERAKPVMAGGGESEDGGFYIYGRTQRDNYDIAKMLRELEIASEWDAAEGRFRILEDDEYGDLAFRLQVEMDDRPVYGRIEKVMKWGGYAEHGMELDEEDDLFDKWEELPDEVQEVLDEYANEEPNPSNVEDMRGRLNALGYDFEYGLDYSPYGLRKMAGGGELTLNEIFEKYPEDKYYVAMKRIHDNMPTYAYVYKKTGKKSDSGRDLYEDKFAATYVETKGYSGKYTPVKGKEMADGGNVKEQEWVAVYVNQEKPNERKVIQVSGNTKEQATRNARMAEGHNGIKKPYELQDIYTHSGNLPMMEGGGKTANLRDVLDDLEDKVGRLSINEESKDVIRADIRHWGDWEHDYMDYERDEEDFEDDDFMKLTNRSYREMNDIVKGVQQRHPEAWVLWDTSEKNHIDFTISHREKMEGGGKTKYWIQGAMKKKGALRAEAKRIGLIKGDEKLSMDDLKKLEAKGGKTAQRARLAMTLQKLRGGGPVKFKDKVESVKKSLLERKKVPKSVQKDYGKTYSPEEAQESAQRIVGAQTARERLMMRIKKGKKKK